MKQSKNWLHAARQLCAQIDPEDGIDPRIIARKRNRNPGNHKSEQLGKEARHILSMIFAGGLRDPVFQALEVIDVSASDDGQFLIVSLAATCSGLEFDEMQLLEKCQAIQGYLRSAIASSVKRKRVPALKFELTYTSQQVVLTRD